MTFKDDFLGQRPNKTIADLKRETEIKQTDYNISKILKERTQKERIKKINKEIKKLLE